MATTGAAQRRHDIGELEAEIVRLKAEIVGGEFAERLANNADFKAYGEFYRKELSDRLEPLPEMESRLVSQAMTPSDAAKLREQVMLLKRDSINVTDFLEFPSRLNTLLKERRERLEGVQAQLKKLKGEDHGG